MPRVNPVEPDRAGEKVRDLLDEVRTRLGMVPNLFLVMGNSPAVLEGFLGLQNALDRGLLPPKLRQLISLAVAQRDRSEYSAAGHAAFGRAAGLSDEEIRDARQGHSANSKVQAALRFACTMVERRGQVADGDWARLRAAGYEEREILEIAGWVCLAMFGDYFAQVTQAEVDFPNLAETSQP